MVQVLIKKNKKMELTDEEKRIIKSHFFEILEREYEKLSKILPLASRLAYGLNPVNTFDPDILVTKYAIQHLVADAQTFIVGVDYLRNLGDLDQSLALSLYLQNDVLTSIIENLKAINEIASDDNAVKISVAIIGEKFKIRN
jgi:hypothetical protein